jgi:hypothetical protein
MPVSLITANTIVTAVGWWNPLATLANTTESGLATEITNRSTAVAAVNTRLNSTIAVGGISDLPTWKTTIDNRTTDATTGNAALGTRLTAAEGSITTNNGSIATLNTRTTDAATGNVALGTRVTSLEASRSSNNDAAYAYQTTAQAVASGTVLTLQAELVDTNAMHDTVTNPSRITIAKTGLYLVSGGVGFAGGGLAASRRIASILRNGAAIPGMSAILPPTSNAAWNLMVPTAAAVLSLTAGDYLELSAYWGAEDSSGVTKTTVVTGGYNSFLSVVYQRP